MKNRKKNLKIKSKNKEGYVSYRMNKIIKSKITKLKMVACLSNRRSMEQSITIKENGAELNIKEHEGESKSKDAGSK